MNRSFVMEDMLEFRSAEKQLLRVLIVEDNLEDGYFAKRAIQRILPDSTVVCVEGIGDAYKACRNIEYDLMLLDLNLPDGFGPNSVQEVRKFFRGAAIFVLTGLASPLTTEQSLQKGANKLFMKKQLSSPEFEAAIRELSYSH
jgi:CheY-like chemotaxis protein